MTLFGGPLPPAISSAEFRLLGDLIANHCGIVFPSESMGRMARRLAPRLAHHGLGTFGEYYRFLCYSPARKDELEAIVELVTTNETYLFRELYQLEALCAEILPEIHERRPRGKELTIWSAGCSSGEEAYTVAILIQETGKFADWKIRIFGNDISRRVLSIARRGLYGRSSFRATDERYLRRYFKEVDGKFEVRQEIKTMTSFGQINLLDEDMLAVVSEVDVVLCRNVLIYFDVASRRRVVRTFARKLLRGGYLLLGHSESLLNISTDFELVHLERDMVYRRPL